LSYDSATAGRAARWPVRGSRADGKPRWWRARSARRAEAGFVGGFALDLHHPVGRYTNDVDIAAAIAAQLGQVGIQVTLRPTDSATFLT
jgi:ABC-type transport system substrate-binding protein